MSIITKQLPWIEKIFLTAVIAGTILLTLKINSSLVKISLLGLGVTFFLSAYRPTELPRSENEKFGFQELLAGTIVPKMLWISSAISTVGIAFYLFNFGNDGYRRLLMIGGLTIATGTMILLISLLQGTKNLGTAAPILYRAIPLLLLDFYILFN
jgi:hypothetical protein